MKKLIAVPGILILAMGVALASPSGRSASKPSSDKWLHVHVQDGSGADAERVRVNVPLSLAEAVIPAINVDKFHQGRIRIDVDGDDNGLHDVDLRKVLQALRGTKDGNFVTVEGKDNVQVAKQGGYLIAKVREGKGSGTKVDVKVPFQVVEALLSGGENELNIAAAVRALGEHGDGVLVTVDDQKSKVRIWVDSENESE
ncbi:MAG TPA: hypothetical protein VGR38_01415 [Candidatus Polarisedimenticolia bacterium]|nr:hypothetical protein [Candidatus Polarisedimenticolia bacterium]